MPVCTDIHMPPAWPKLALRPCCATGIANLGRAASLAAASSAFFFFSSSWRSRRSMRSCVRLARSAKSPASALSATSWVSSLVFAATGFTEAGSGAAIVVVSSPGLSVPVSPPTEAAATPATPITQAEGTATVSRAERFAGVRRRPPADLAPVVLALPLAAVRRAERGAEVTGMAWVGMSCTPCSSWTSGSSYASAVSGAGSESTSKTAVSL